MASTLGIDTSATGRAELTSRSTNGGLTWQNPVTVAQTATNFFDKNWIACDNYPSSPFYGTCYTERDDNTLGNRLLMSRSTDGGLYPETNCSASTCQLYAGFVSSWNGGITWSLPRTLYGPMMLSWIASSSQGRMVGDYVSTSFADSEAHAVFTAARPPSGGTYDHAIWSAAIPAIGSGTAPNA